VTSDHEPITAEEARLRARQGLALMLRQSSLRPDLRQLLRGLLATGAAPARLMLTTDGSTPAWTAEHGFVDGLVRLALEEGVPPVDAYRIPARRPAHRPRGVGRQGRPRPPAEPPPLTALTRGAGGCRRAALRV